MLLSFHRRQLFGALFYYFTVYCSGFGSSRFSARNAKAKKSLGNLPTRNLHNFMPMLETRGLHGQVGFYRSMALPFQASLPDELVRFRLRI